MKELLNKLKGKLGMAVLGFLSGCVVSAFIDYFV